MKKQTNKKYKLVKDKKYKRVKGNFGNIFKEKIYTVVFIALGTIVAFTGTSLLKKHLIKKEINKTTFSKILKMNKDNTCLDELLETVETLNNTEELEKNSKYIGAANEIAILERQLEASEKLAEIDFEKYDIKTIEEELDYSNITIETIESNLKLYNEYIEKIKKNIINLDIPSEETQKFYELLFKMKNYDELACNKYILESYEKIENLYSLAIRAKFLDECELDETELNNVDFTYDTEIKEVDDGHAYTEYNYNLTYDNPNISTNKTFDYEIKKGFNKVIDSNLDEVTENVTRAKWKDNANYNPERNKIIQAGLNKIKQIITLYNINCKTSSNGQNIIDSKPNYNYYKKLKK